MRSWFFSLFFFCLLKGNAQPFTQWAQTVNWDGVSHWSKYMITQPAYQGPNSSPVPRMGNGSIDSNFSISATGTFHFSKGDNTQNLSLYANYCLVKDIISFDAAWVPYEHFIMNQAVKEKRHVFSQFFYDTDASGELHLNTNIQVLNKWKKYIRLALRVGYRFPTGSGFGAARYTDGPGYYFDLSFGKSFNHSALKWVGMLGFYSWHIESDKHKQKDAFRFGPGPGTRVLWGRHPAQGGVEKGMAPPLRAGCSCHQGEPSCGWIGRSAVTAAQGQSRNGNRAYPLTQRPRVSSVRAQQGPVPCGRVTAHRVTLTLYSLDEILAGGVDAVIEPLLAEYQADQLAAIGE